KQQEWRRNKKDFLRKNPGTTFGTPKPPDTAAQAVYRERALGNELRAFPLFANLPQDITADLVQRADFISLIPDEVVWREGDPSDDLLLVRRGFLKIAREEPDGSRTIINYLSKGQFLGEKAVISDGWG